MEISGFRIGFAGSSDRKVTERYGLLAEAIGKEIAKRGHRMVSGGCSGGTTQMCAEGVLQCLKESGREKELDHRIINILPGKGGKFAFIGYGNAMICQNYDRDGRRPLMASYMDVLITIHGGKGTMSEIEAALKVGTPVVPIWTTGGASHEKWLEIKAKKDSELVPFRYYREAFIHNYITGFDDNGDFSDQAFCCSMAQEVVDVAIKMAAKKCGHCFDLSASNNDNAFIIMPFGREFEKVYAAINKVFSKREGTNDPIYTLPADLTCTRGDQRKIGSIDRSLQKKIYEASFLIVDLTDNNPNVMFELGIGLGLGKKAILINQYPDRSAIDLANLIQIQYSLTELNKLTENLADAINQLYKKDEGRGFF